MSIINCLAESGQEVFEEPKGCVVKYKEGKGFNYPQSGDLLAPWVAIDFVDKNFQRGNGVAITVSNLSSQVTTPQNCAIISSFTFGHSDGCAARFTVHDTHGGAFAEFMNHLLTSWDTVKNPSDAIYMRTQFGWVKSGCKEPIPASRSPCYNIFVESVETNFTEGKFIFEITGRDACGPMFEGSAKWEAGGSGKESIQLIPAMINFLCDPNSPGPNIKRIEFKVGPILYPFNSGSNLSNQNDKIFDVGTDDQEKKLGRKQAYQAHGKNKIEVVRKWLQDQPSINGNPWNVKYDPEKEVLLIQEHIVDQTKCKPDSFFDNEDISEGTYIVNGGPLSPVLEFNPKIKWPWFAVTGGAGGQMGDQNANAMQSEGSENKGAECLPKEKVDGAGLTTSTPTGDGPLDEGGADVVKKDAQKEAKRSMLLSPSYEAISADLVIIGDPDFCPPQFVQGKFCGIVLLNPFFIEKRSGTGPCGDWYLADSACNKVISNKGWMIMGVTHQISAGKYTTTINVRLDAPNINLAEDMPTGGWCDGWKPKQAI